MEASRLVDVHVPRLLVVDDNADNRDVLTRRLRRLGHDAVDTAEDGQAALTAIRGQMEAGACGGAGQDQVAGVVGAEVEPGFEVAQQRVDRDAVLTGGGDEGVADHALVPGMGPITNRGQRVSASSQFRGAASRSRQPRRWPGCMM